MRDYIRLCRQEGFFRVTGYLIREMALNRWGYAVWIAAVAVVALAFNAWATEPLRSGDVKTVTEIDATAVVDASVIEMRGYGPDGKPGTFLYDCTHPTDDQGVDATLVCTQREDQP